MQHLIAWSGHLLVGRAQIVMVKLCGLAYTLLVVMG